MRVRGRACCTEFGLVCAAGPCAARNLAQSELPGRDLHGISPNRSPKRFLAPIRPKNVQPAALRASSIPMREKNVQQLAADGSGRARDEAQPQLELPVAYVLKPLSVPLAPAAREVLASLPKRDAHEVDEATKRHVVGCL